MDSVDETHHFSGSRRGRDITVTSEQNRAKQRNSFELKNDRTLTHSLTNERLEKLPTQVIKHVRP